MKYYLFILLTLIPVPKSCCCVSAGKGGSALDSVPYSCSLLLLLGTYGQLFSALAQLSTIERGTPQADRHYYRFEGALPTIGTSRFHP